MIDKYLIQGREGTADLLKGSAVLFMIQVHITELFLNAEIYDSLVGKISLFLGGPPAAPLFMAVMGYFAAFSKKQFSEKLHRGIYLIIGGYLLNLALNANLLMHIHRKEFLLDPYPYIFGVDILFLAGLSIILLAVLEKFKLNGNIPLIIITALFVSLHPFLPQAAGGIAAYINAYFWGDYHWSYFPMLPWSGYVFAGYFFAKNRERIREKFTFPVRIIGLLIMIAGFYHAIELSADLPSYYHHTILFFQWTIIFLSIFTYAVGEIEKKIGKKFILLFIKFLGQNVTAVYVFQWVIIGNLATEVYRTLSFLEGTISFVLILAVVTLLTGLYKSIKKMYFVKI